MNQVKNMKWVTYFKGNNIKRFGFFLFAAFLFLILTKLSETYTQEVTFNIELTNLEEEIILTSDSTNTVDVILSGKGFNMLPYSLYKSKIIYLDAQNDVYSTREKFYWDAVNNRHIINETIGNSIEIRSIKPDTLVMEFDVLATKIVPLRFKHNIIFEPGFDILGDYTLSQDSVKLVGSEAILNTISEIETKALKLDNIKTDIKQVVDLQTLDVSNITIIPNSIEVIGKVKRFTEGKLFVPINILNLPLDKEINYFPKQVEVVYYVDLENFNSVKATDFSVIADFENLNNSTQRFLELKIVKSPMLVKTTRLSQNKVEYIISE